MELVDAHPRYAGRRLLRFWKHHPGGFNMACCDGSSRFVSYTIDVEAHRRLCNRKDNLPVDPKSF